MKDSSGRIGCSSDLLPCGLKKRTELNDSSRNSDTMSETDAASSSCRLMIRSSTLTLMLLMSLLERKCLRETD